MTFILGTRSLQTLQGVEPRLVAVARLAISITEQDFAIFPPGGVRTLAEEKQLVAEGKSHSLKSHHLIQANGFGGACDAVPWVGGGPVWEWPRIFLIARAFQAAFAQLGIEGTWGAVWDKLMSEYGDPAAEEAAYVRRMQAGGSHDVFVDGPHFELGRN
jgi:peptidoglycan L-alanyl-D-glutamate endopeptidase CwlK